LKLHHVQTLGLHIVKS